MKVLVLSFYYAPDLSAGSFRTTALVRALVDRLPPDAEIDVITTLPNRYSSFSVDVPAEERLGRVRVRRIALPAHQNGMLDQAIAFLTFARRAMSIARAESYALVYATSSRLMTAVLGAWIARRQRAALYLDIRDIFVETMREVLRAPMASLVEPVLGLLERFAISTATRVNLVSEGFAGYFAERYPGRRFSYYTNGIDDEFVGFDANDSRKRATEMQTVLYAGNIGEGQGLDVIVPELARRTQDRLQFRVVGDGGRRRALERRIAADRLTNVALLPPMNREALMAEYRAADVLFLHLNDYVAFKRVLPSKIFEYAASGKPIWAGAAGYAAEFLARHVENAVVFAPCDASEALDAFKRLDLSWSPRRAFIDRFARRAISDALATDIASTLKERVS